jgi:hypothetical protein
VVLAEVEIQPSEGDVEKECKLFQSRDRLESSNGSGGAVKIAPDNVGGGVLVTRWLVRKVSGARGLTLDHGFGRSMPLM